MLDLKQTPAIGEEIIARSFPPITRHVLALYCGASGDLNPIHVDSDFARDAGFPDVFAHGMLVMAYLGQALTDAVPPASLRSFSTRFVAITRLGARIDCTGEVVEIFEEAGEKRMRIALVAQDQDGDVKLKGDAVVAAPAHDEAQAGRPAGG